MKILFAVLISIATMAPSNASACNDHKHEAKSKPTTCTSSTNVAGTMRTVCR